MYHRLAPLLAAFFAPVVTISSAWMAEPAAGAPTAIAPVVPAVAPVTAPPAIKLTLKPQSLSLNYNQYWQNDGSLSNDNGNFNLSFFVFSEGKVPVVGLGDLEVTDAITDTGEHLTLQGNERSQDDDNDNDNEKGRHKPVGRVNFSLSAPTRPTAMVKSITGTIAMVTSNGRFKWAELKPFKAYVGKRLHIIGVEGAEVTVAHGRNNMLELRYPQSTEALIDDIQFYDETGATLEANRSGSNNNGATKMRYYTVSVPDDGWIELKLHAVAVTTKVPFTITNLRMPGAASADTTFDANIQAIDHGEPLPELGGDHDMAPVKDMDVPEDKVAPEAEKVAPAKAVPVPALQKK